MYYDRQYKASVFALLYEDKENLMDLYNGLYDEKCTESDKISINTLKDEDGVESGIFMKFRNDLSFIFDSHLHLYEHQSSVNKNIPLRMLIYVTVLIKKLVKTKELYKEKAVGIPAPRFVVFYNGTEDMPAKTELRLSDQYMVKAKDPELELKVTVYNINIEKGGELLMRSRTLREYMLFVDKAREAMQGKETEEDKRAAMNGVIDWCIERDILAEFMKKHRKEIVMISILQYDQEAHEAAICEEAHDAGYDEGHDAGYDEGHDAGYGEGHGKGYEEGEVCVHIDQISKKKAKGKTHQIIADEIETDISFVDEICSIAESISPEFDVKTICAEYMSRHRLKEEGKRCQI